MAEHQNLNYERAGSGETILLLHGIGGELGVWDPVWTALIRTCDIIAVDLPGFGRSPALPAGVAPSPQVIAGVIAAFLARLGIDRAHVVGNSLGGWIALELAKGHGARSVTALSPAGLWGAPLLARGAPARGGAHRVVHGLRPALPVLLRSRRVRRLALGHVVADPDLVPYRPALRMVRSYARGGAYDATNTAMRQTFFADPQQIAVPVTLAFGERDRLVRPARLPIPGAWSPYASRMRSHPDVGRPGPRQPADPRGRDVRLGLSTAGRATPAHVEVAGRWPLP